MTPERPPNIPEELWGRMLAFNKDDEEFRERKQRFLSSLETGNDKMMDRALDQLRVDEEALRARGAALAIELREEHGLGI